MSFIVAAEVNALWYPRTSLFITNPAGAGNGIADNVSPKKLKS